MNDPVATMDDLAVEKACLKIVNWKYGSPTAPVVIGLIIQTLQEWGIKIEWHPSTKWTLSGSCYSSKDLQRAFLKQAIILGEWTVPNPLTIEERVERLETFIAKRSEQFPDLR